MKMMAPGLNEYFLCRQRSRRQFVVAEPLPGFDAAPACSKETDESDCTQVSSKYRTFSGRCNNLRYPLYGKHTVPFRRHFRPEYNDGFASPKLRGAKSVNVLPNPRSVSTAVHKDRTDEKDKR
jgi:hypothetical protein